MASSRVEMMSSWSPVCRATRSTNSPALAARRHASVAMARMPLVGRRASRSAQACRASTARSIAWALSCPRLLQSLAQPNDPTEAVQHAKPVGRGCADQQPAVVGPQIHRCERGGARVTNGVCVRELHCSKTVNLSVMNGKHFTYVVVRLVRRHDVAALRSGPPGGISAAAADGGSSNGRTADSDSAYRGSNPRPPTSSATT